MKAFLPYSSSAPPPPPPTRNGLCLSLVPPVRPPCLCLPAACPPPAAASALLLQRSPLLHSLGQTTPDAKIKENADGRTTEAERWFLEPLPKPPKGCGSRRWSRGFGFAVPEEENPPPPPRMMSLSFTACAERERERERRPCVYAVVLQRFKKCTYASASLLLLSFPEFPLLLSSVSRRVDRRPPDFFSWLGPIQGNTGSRNFRNRTFISILYNT